MTPELKKEIERLRALNPHVRMFEKGWIKLVHTARLNVCRQLGLDDSVAVEILRSHENMYDADIVINS